MVCIVILRWNTDVDVKIKTRCRPAAQLRALEAELVARDQLNAEGGVLLHTNVHSGSDGWPEQDQAEYPASLYNHDPWFPPPSRIN